MRSFAIIAAVTTLTLAGCAPPAPPRVAKSLAPSTTPVAAAASMSLASCASTNCHGRAATTTPDWTNAATVWLDKDPHRNAFAILYTARAITMVQRLQGWPLEPTPADQAYLQALKQNCTNCHAVSDTPLTTATADQLALGVTCGGCHGAPINWGHAHYQADWRVGKEELSPASRKTNFQDLRPLASRAAVCVRCHVGPCESSPHVAPQSVNHDLIAAGHPRLEFEFSAFLANLPKHWCQAKDKQQHCKASGTDVENLTYHFDAWVIGQEARTQKQLEAAKRPNGAVDFAQYDCFACHHDLASSLSDNGDSWRQTPDYLARRALFQTVFTPGDEAQIERRALIPSLPPPPDDVKKAPLADADQQLHALRQWWESTNPQDWQSLLQLQLALDAWLADRPASHGELRECAAELRSLLHDCFPQGESATQYDSPSRFRLDDQRLTAAWKRIDNLLQQAKP